LRARFRLGTQYPLLWNGGQAWVRAGEGAELSLRYTGDTGQPPRTRRRSRRSSWRGDGPGWRTRSGGGGDRGHRARL